MTELSGWKKAAAVFVLCAVSAIASPTQTFNTIVNFDGADGVSPSASLLQSANGNLYGTTYEGGDFTCNPPYGCGTVFQVALGGTLTTLHNFNGADGDQPSGVLVQATDGNFYGATLRGGGSMCDGGCGTLFRITPQGTLTTLHTFDSTDGAMPYGGLFQATDGSLYGTTYLGGDSTCNAPYGCGTVFKFTLKGTLTVLHAFVGYPADGQAPDAGLIQATDGNLYGITEIGGYYNNGLVFKISLGGVLTQLYSFCPPPSCSNASYPSGGLVQGGDGNFYGTTFGGGGSFSCGLGCGTVFKITPQGFLTTLHNFTGTDGAQPAAGVIQATDGNFYGTTSGFGTDSYGTLFNITSTGILTNLHNFCVQSLCADGANPIGGLVQDTNGTFYGTTYYGGTNNYGTLFSFSVGLGPFVSLVRTAGKVGQNDGILGQGFTGNIGVFFSETPANFTVKSPTFLTVAVPPGATTGSVTVTTPSGTLTSNVPFRVTPQLLHFSPPSGPVGTIVTLTGVSLTQTQGVGFGNHVPASFTVNSDTQVTATVPQGAKTGKVGVQTQGGTAISSATFTVTR